VWASFLAVPTGRYAFENPQALLGFLARLAERRVTEAFRSRFQTERNDIARELPTGGGDQAQNRIPAPPGTPSQWVIAGEEWERIVSRFPPGHRAILERLREGYTLDDIARMANVSRSTVDRIVRRLKDLTKC
jgi:DNA-directed RNA polymerase specialized sigma24 family protein